MKKNSLSQTLSKKKVDEQRKREEEERLAAAHKEFLDAFSDGPKLDKTWVRGGTADSERRGNVSDSDTSRRKGGSTLPIILGFCFSYFM